MNKQENIFQEEIEKFQKRRKKYNLMKEVFEETFFKYKEKLVEIFDKQKGLKASLDFYKEDENKYSKILIHFKGFKEEKEVLRSNLKHPQKIKIILKEDKLLIKSLFKNKEKNTNIVEYMFERKVKMTDKRLEKFYKNKVKKALKKSVDLTLNNLKK